MHKLLVRQLRRAGVAPEALTAELRGLLDLVDEAYRQGDSDRALVERSLDLTSQELLTRNRQLQEELATRLRAESALRASEERYRVLFDASPLAILVFAVDTLLIIECNTAALAMYGYTREELCRMRVSDLKADPEDPELRAMPLAPPQTWRGTKTHRRKDGSLVEVALTAHALVLDGRRVVLVMGADVGETRRLEDRLRQSQKMEAVGLLAGGIAHDFNNIIAVMLAYADFASSALDPTHIAAQDIQEIATAARRAAALTHQLLAFSRKQPYQPRIVTINSVVVGMSTMLRRVLGEDVKLTTVPSVTPWSVKADPGLLEQVLLNLAVNARDAMPGGGELTIATRNDTLGEARAEDLEVEPGQHVVLCVTDTGRGMDEATRARIFEPFFTTKEIGKGTGLGLATVFGIVKQSGGSISVRSQPSRGTEFEVYLPRVRGLADSRPSQRPVVPDDRGSETVLVVEDDPQVQAAVCRVLGTRGYHVLRADGPREAMAILLEGNQNVGVLLTDIVMPEIDGRALAARANQLHPQLKVVFMSGHTQHPAVDGAPFGPDDQLVRKPFTPQELARAVRVALDGAGPPAP